MRYTAPMDGSGKAAFWTFFGMAIGFKVFTSIVIFVMQPTLWNATFLLAMQWYWLVAPIPFLIVPGLFWYRLVRVRRRRRQLIHAEWLVSSEADWNPTTTRGTM